MNFANQWAFAKMKRKNLYAYGTSLQLQATIREIKIAKIVRCGVFTQYLWRENLYAYGKTLGCAHGDHVILTSKHDE